MCPGVLPLTDTPAHRLAHTLTGMDKSMDWCETGGWSGSIPDREKDFFFLGRYSYRHPLRLRSRSDASLGGFLILLFRDRLRHIAATAKREPRGIPVSAAAATANNSGCEKRENHGTPNRQPPRGRLPLASGVVGCNGLCIYHHLPHIYHFWNGVFDVL